MSSSVDVPSSIHVSRSERDEHTKMEVHVSQTVSVQREVITTEETVPLVVPTNTEKKSNGFTVEHVNLAQSQPVSSYRVVFIPQTHNQKLQASKNNGYDKPIRTLQKRPSSARGTLRSNLARSPMAPVRSGFSPAKNRTTTAEITIGRPSPKSVKASFVQTSLPESEDLITTRAWLKLYSLPSMNLDLIKILEGPECEHADDKIVTIYNNKPAKYCYLYPCVNVNGTVKHLELSPSQLQDYHNQVDLLLRRYLKRLIWLLSGSRRVFGTVVHRNCLILIDTSGSMTPYIEELKKELVSMIMEQFHDRDCSFNLMCFAGKYETWSDQLQPATPENCQSAIDWVNKLKTYGSTKTLEALKLAFDHQGVDSIYLLTDGKPDMGTEETLKQAVADNTRQVPVNTTSFNCNDITANSFLQSLAIQTGGRYHRCHVEFNGQQFAQRLHEEGQKDPAHPPLPPFESDDLYRLGQEISLARQYLQQVKQLKSLYGQAGRDPEGSGTRLPIQQPVPPRMRSLSVCSTRSQIQRSRSAKSGQSETPLKFNFFRDTYWVPGVWGKYWKYSPPKDLVTGIINPLLPEKEEQITSEEWLKTYMVSLYRLHLQELVPGAESPSKFSDIYALFKVGGKKKFLRLLPKELTYYEILIDRVYQRYLKRLYWLLTSSRLVFGTIIHKNCVIVVDTSGSMQSSMEIMKKALVALLWEQINSHRCMFTVLEFNAIVKFWKEGLQPSTKENCEAAITWVGGLNAGGGTNTMDAVKAALQVPGLDSVYFLSDGAPNQPPADILKMVETQFQNRLPINTISFNCQSAEANKFLEDMATQTNGRYHRYLSNSKAMQVAPKIEKKELLESDITLLSELEGNDLRALVAEIKVARKYLQQVRQYKSLSRKKENERPHELARASIRPKTKLHKFFEQRPASHGTFLSRPKSAMQ